MLLAIESSCDETSVALFDSDKVLSKNSDIKESYLGQQIKSQIDLHKEYGGVVPELAARQHSDALPIMVTSILKNFGLQYQDLKYIAVTSGPGLKGCLLVGLAYAKGLSEALDIPLIPINHLEGHVLSYSLNYDSRNIPPSLCLLVSGGHSEIILVNDIGKYKILCETSDDAAGEAFDKIGTLLGINYPAGRELSELASQSKESRFVFPEAVHKDFSSFSFSGLKTAVKREVESFKKTHGGLSCEYKADISFSVQEAIVNSLISKLEYWVKEISPQNLILAGGVASNNLLRDRVDSLGCRYSIRVMKPSHEFCTDNAAMIGAAGLLRLQHELLNKNQIHVYKSIGANPRWGLEDT